MWPGRKQAGQGIPLSACTRGRSAAPEDHEACGAPPHRSQDRPQGLLPCRGRRGPPAGGPGAHERQSDPPAGIAERARAA